MDGLVIPILKNLTVDLGPVNAAIHQLCKGVLVCEAELLIELLDAALTGDGVPQAPGVHLPRLFALVAFVKCIATLRGYPEITLVAMGGGGGQLKANIG